MAATALMLCTVAPAAEKEIKFDYKPPVVGKGLFDEKLVMLDRERGEYATNLASYAANLLNETRASTTAVADARKLLALAMHLSPRNQKALVVNHQLRRGVLPDTTDGVYSAGVFARLLLTRAQLLLREGGVQDRLLARAFIELATEMDPRNEEAVYAFELQRLDHGDFNWERITDYKEPEIFVPAPPAKVPEAAPAKKPEAKPAAKPTPRPASGRPGGTPGRRPG